MILVFIQSVYATFWEQMEAKEHAIQRMVNVLVYKTLMVLLVISVHLGITTSPVEKVALSAIVIRMDHLKEAATRFVIITQSLFIIAQSNVLLFTSLWNAFMAKSVTQFFLHNGRKLF